jgi:hypothetical protein
MAWPVSLPASSSPLMSRPVMRSRYSYAPGRARISSVFMPAVIASGLPDSVPACDSHAPSQHDCSDPCKPEAGCQPTLVAGQFSGRNPCNDVLSCQHILVIFRLQS